MTISKEEALVKFKEILEGKVDWATLKDSQFVDHLSIFQSWALRQGLFDIERSMQEFFLSTALNESSIRAHAEDREYLPRKPIPSTGLCTVVNNGAYQVSIPQDQPFESGAQIYYVAMAPLVLAAGAAGTLEVSQTKRNIVTHTVTEEKAFYEILFDADVTTKLNSFAVTVDLQDGNGFQDMAYSRLFQNVDAEDLVYDEFYAHTGQTGIRFGNGVFGTILPVGAIVQIDMWLTEGSSFLASGQQLHVVGDLLDFNEEQVDLAITTINSVTGGVAGEEGEELRANLHYWPIYNERLVWREDYRFFLRRRFPNILWCKVWGEEEAEEAAGAPDVDFINKIFISAYEQNNSQGNWVDATDYSVDDTVLITDGTALVCIKAHTSETPEPTGADTNWALFETLEDRCLEALQGVPLLNRKYEWTDPDFVTFSLAITGKVSRTLVLATVEQTIIDVLTNNYGKDSGTRRTDIFLKDFYDLINETSFFGDSGAYFDIEITGDTTPTDLNDMVHIDMAATTISLEYV